MRSLCLCVFLLAAAAWASDGQFNGKWDIQVPHESKSRVWWLEVSGAESGGPLKGKFVGFPGGNTNEIEKIAIHNGELEFHYDGGQNHFTYRARVVGGKLEGSCDCGKEKLQFSGVRAPKIKDRDDGSWKLDKPIILFDGKDLAGWQAVVPGQPLGWEIKNGILGNQAAANNLVSDKKFWNFDLHAEFRVSPNTNSGIGLRARYEVQILDDYGKPPNTHGNGALYTARFFRAKMPAFRPASGRASTSGLLGCT